MGRKLLSADIWYFAKGEITIGPLTLTELIAVLPKQPDPMRTYVSDGIMDWTQACEVPELRRHFVRSPALSLRYLASATITPPFVIEGGWLAFRDQYAALAKLQLRRLSTSALTLASLIAKHSVTESIASKTEGKKPGWRRKAGIIGGLSLLALVIVGALGVTLGNDIVRGVRERSSARQLHEVPKMDSVQAMKEGSAIEQLRDDLQRTLPSLRAALPKKIDDLTTMIAVDAKDEWLMHHFRVDGELADFKGVNFGSEMRKLFVPAACKEAQFRITLGKGAKYQFLYSDRNGQLIGSFVMVKNDCQV
jgi:hypothetical protein